MQHGRNIRGWAKVYSAMKGFLGFLQSGPDLRIYLLAIKPLGKMIISVLFFGYFGSVFGQSWSQDPFERVKLDKMIQKSLRFSPVDQF